MIYRINLTRENIITSIDGEKDLHIFQYSFIIAFNKVSIKEICLNTIKVTYEKPTANVITNGGKQKLLL